MYFYILTLELIFKAINFKVSDMAYEPFVMFALKR